MAHDAEPTLVIEATGGVDAPSSIVAAAAARSVQGKARLILVGDGQRLGAELARRSYDPMRLRIVDAGIRQPHATGDLLAQSEVARATLPICFELLRNGEADALVTAAPGHVVRSLAVASLRPIRPGAPVALASVVPTLPRSGHADPLALLLDVSGETAADAVALHAFATMGATYARLVTGIRQPTVALLSTGTDPTDGPPAVVDAHRSLRRATSRSNFHFVGNVRAVDIPRGLADVVVVDGFAGFAVRSLLEGLTDLTVEAARYAWKARTTWRVGLRLLSDGVGQLQRVSEFRQYGGAPILGLEQLVLVAAPDAGEHALDNAIKLSLKCVRANLMTELASDLAAAVDPSERTGGVDGGR